MTAALRDTAGGAKRAIALRIALASRKPVGHGVPPRASRDSACAARRPGATCTPTQATPVSQRRTRRDPAAGFTLIEALVAMAILAAGGVTLLTAVQSHATRVAGLSDRVVARWVAEERLTALALGLDDTAPSATMMGRPWRVETTRTPTADPALARIDVAVGLPDADSTFVTLTGFVETPPPATEEPAR